jgi:two-component sensor histidine kinase
MHELCTNAAKYGALSVESGTIAIDWRASGDGQERRLLLTWREQGGPEVKPPARRGFGTRMIERGLSAELGGQVTMEFAPEGLRCVLDAAMPATVARASPSA